MLSAKEGSCEIVDILLHHQARPNAVDEESGYTALMFAAEAGHLDVVSSLLRANAQVSLKNKGGMTAYYLAYRSKHVDVAKALYQAHNVQTTLPVHPMMPPSGEQTADNTSVEVLNYISILLDRLKQPPLLMDPDYPTAGRKRRRWAGGGRQQTLGGHLLAVGAS
jgi:ankyrin repeat protein